MPCLGATTADDLLEGRLTPARARDVEAHVADCGDCRTLLAALARSQPPANDGVANDGVANDGVADASREGTAEASAPRRGDAVGRYWIQGPLGEGGMGVVYLAFDPELGRRVAVKLLHAAGGAADAVGRARLLREARTVAQLSHPNVIQVYEVGVWREQVFLAMEYVEGATLRAHLAAARRPWREIVTLFVAAGRALAAAHAAGVVHRDFKPDNVLVGAGGRVRVSDFGLARVVLGDDGGAPARPETRTATRDASLTRTGAVLGTPRYMAPEQRAGRTADARADQYSFCLALAEALRTAPRVPWRLRRVLARGLRERPLERHAGMDALTGALERAAGTGVAARAPWIAVAALLALATTAAAVAWRAREDASAAHAALVRAEAGTAAERAAVRVERRVRGEGLGAARATIATLRAAVAPVAPGATGRAGGAPLVIVGSLAPPAPVPAPPAVAPELVETTVRERLPELRACYDDARRSAPALEGTAVVSFVVGADGVVTEVEVAGLGHLGGESCIARVFRALRFAPTPGGAAIGASYPLRFTRPTTMTPPPATER